MESVPVRCSVDVYQVLLKEACILYSLHQIVPSLQCSLHYGLHMYHYENMSMQYTEIFKDVNNENFQ